jgi:hypothetical protein
MPTTPEHDDPWLPENPGKVRDAIRFRVSRYEPSEDGYKGDESSPFVELDNVVCCSIDNPLGTDVGTARVRYRFTGTDAAAPQGFEEAISDAVDLPKVINPNDRIVIHALRPSDEAWV